MASISFIGSDLAGDFERPSGWFWDSVAASVEATVLRLDAPTGTVAVRVTGRRGRCGVGVWELGTRRVRWANDWADNVQFLNTTQSMLVCDQRRLVRYSWPGLAVVDEVDAHQYTEYLVVSPSERLLLVWLNDGQGANGYEVFALEPTLRRLGIGEIMTLDSMYCMPVFSPDERVVACSPGVGGTWWTPPVEQWPSDFTEEAEIPSLGGPVTFALLVVHDIERDVVSRHRLQFDLDPGWVPTDVWDERWEYGAIGVEFPTDDQLQLTLPDGATTRLRLPVPEAVRLPTPSRTLPEAR